MLEQSSLAARLFRILILLYPKDFRADFGFELHEALAESVRIERGKRRSELSIAVRITWDTLRSAATLHRRSRTFGSVQREQGWGERMMDAWTRNLRTSLRQLRRSPGFALVAVLTVALGIAANTMIFTLVNGLFLRELPVEEADELFYVWSDFSAIGIPRGWTSGPQHDYLAQRAELVEAFAAIQGAGATVAGPEGGNPQRAYLNRVTANFFDVLGAVPMVGRTFAPGESGPGAPQVAVLGHAYWQRVFGGDPAMVGREMLLGGDPFTVIGVMPPEFHFRLHTSLGGANEPEFWVPLPDDVANASRYDHHYGLLGRAEDGVPFSAVRDQIAELGRAYGDEYYNADGFTFNAVQVRPDLIRDVRSALLMLMGAVAFLLLIVSANIATLFLSRSFARTRDVAVRTALGAGRASIAGLMLSEALVVAAVGGALGLVLARMGMDGMLALVPTSLPLEEQIRLDWVVAGFTFATTALVALLAGSVPAVRMSRPDLQEDLKAGSSGGGASAGARRTQRGLVAVQVALSLVLLTGAGLLGKSLLGLFEIDPGFATDGVVMATLDLPDERYPEGEQITALVDRLEDELRGSSMFVAVGVTDAPPLSGGANRQSDWTPSGAELVVEDGEQAFTDYLRVTPGYFAAIGMRLEEGAPVDSRPGWEGVVIDTQLADIYWRATSPVGAEVNPADESTPARQVVGVVTHARLYNVYEDDRGQVYRPFHGDPDGDFTVVASYAGSDEAALDALRATIDRLDPTVSVRGVRTIAEVVSDSLSGFRFSLQLLGVFALAAVLLAALGIYGVVTYSVQARTRELGIRIALGAARERVARMVVGQGLRPVLVGVVVGLGAAFALSGTMSALLVDVRPTDPSALFLAVLVLCATAIGAAWMPARRATRISPTEAFRTE